jgi:predicted amidohydrolase
MKLALIHPELDYFDASRNLDVIRRALSFASHLLGPNDIALLPEHWDPEPDKDKHIERLRLLTRDAGCHIVGGSHHESRGDHAVNTGYALAPDGAVLGAYDKLRPYAEERTRVRAGERLGEIDVAGRRVLVLVCADFWFSDLVDRANGLPDLILVPALSVTRKPTPDYSRALWRHMAIARSYELATYVGVSDWAPGSELMSLQVSGVGGLANPTTTDPQRLFTHAVHGSATVFDLDFDALDAFRDDRRARGFFWR